MRPDDFIIKYNWTEGSLPPPDHYEYEIHIGPGDTGKIIFYPDYPSKNTPVWTEEFHLKNTTIDSLYQLLIDKDIILRNWTEIEDITVGDELEWMEGTANKVHFKIPCTIEEHEIVESIYKYVRAIVPEQIWTELMSRQQQYQRNYSEDRE